MIKNIAISVVVYAFVATTAAYFYFGRGFSANVFIGALIVLLNLAALSFSWKRIFSKKSIALAIFVIIFKYVILGMILWGLSKNGWLNIIGFLAGLASLLFSVFAAMAIKTLRKENL